MIRLTQKARRPGMGALLLAILVVAETPNLIAADSPPRIALVEQGVARSVVILPEQPGSTLRRIAGRFVEIVERATGAELPVVTEDKANTFPSDFVRIYLGSTKESTKAGLNLEELPEEGYRLVSKGNRVWVLGRDAVEDSAKPRTNPASVPTWWALNGLLGDQLGVRWLWPGELGTYVPKSKDFSIPEMDVTYQPKLLQRRLRVVLNYSKNGTGSAVEKIMEQEAFDWQESHQAGRRGDIRFGHAFTHWWEKFSKSHPDYFAVAPPEVKVETLQARYAKLRLANPEVIEEIAREYQAAGAPKYWNVCPNDGSGFDVSAETRAWDLPLDQPIDEIWNSRAKLTARYVMFWNRLADRLKQINPEVLLCTYAYSCYKEPPPKDRPLTAKMVVGLVLSYYDFELWQGWADTGSQLFLRPNWWHIGANAPYLPLDETAAFMRFASKNGMIGLDVDSIIGYWATQGMNYYLVARLMIHPDYSKEQILTEYTSAFGSAAPKIRDYLDYWQKVTSEYRYPAPDGKFQALQAAGKVDRVITRASRLMLPYLYGDDVLQPAYALLAEAEKLTLDEPEAFARVQFLRSGLDEMKATRNLVATSLSARENGETAEMKKRFYQEADALEKLRTQLSGQHVVWGSLITSDEERRGVYFIPRVVKKTPEETNEM